MSEFNVNESRTAQEKYCKENSLPHFAPSSGRCWNCNKNIYEPNEKERTLFWEKGKPTEKYTTGITVEKAANELITGCPHCNRTYCD